MAKLLCPNITSDQNDYAAPVPMIGLYIAVATMVCFLLMLGDVINGIRCRKPWLPCRFFSLNSFTLTLLSIATKLPVDLTTSMPSAEDQLSKIMGTALLCVSMTFFIPSLGNNKASECFTNMASLTILVVTVIVNVCIQISTGLIFSFIVEHAIIMFCMVMSLLLMWISTSEINIQKDIQMDRKKDLFTNGSGSMFRRLKLCYLHAYNSDPQFVLCKSRETIFALVPCLLSLIFVLEVTIRSLVRHEYKFCTGLSDYGWSMRIIVMTQIVVILLANFAIGFRWHVNFRDCADISSSVGGETFDIIISGAPLLKAQTRDYLYLLFNHAMSIGYILMAFAFMLPYLYLGVAYNMAVRIIDSCGFYPWERNQAKRLEECRALLHEHGLVLGEWTLTKCVKEIKRLMIVTEEIDPPVRHLKYLLATRARSRQTFEEFNCQLDFKEGNELSCLHLVLLVRIASVSVPSNLSGYITRYLSEVFDIIHFIDAKTNSSRSNSRKKRMLAKAMWMGEDFSILTKNVERLANDSDLDHALGIIKRLPTELPSFISDEASIIVAFINHRESTSIEDLYGHMEQLFVDMIYILITRFPDVVYKEIMESPAEEYEEKTRLMLKYLCRIKSLNSMVFPC